MWGGFEVLSLSCEINRQASSAQSDTSKEARLQQLELQLTDRLAPTGS